MQVHHHFSGYSSRKVGRYEANANGGHQRTCKDEAGLRARMTTGRKAQDRIGENLGRVEDEGVRRKKGVKCI
jgi:hypothetical protein